MAATTLMAFRVPFSPLVMTFRYNLPCSLLPLCPGENTKSLWLGGGGAKHCPLLGGSVLDSGLQVVQRQAQLVPDGARFIFSRGVALGWVGFFLRLVCSRPRVVQLVRPYGSLKLGQEGTRLSTLTIVKWWWCWELATLEVARIKPITLWFNILMIRFWSSRHAPLQVVRVKHILTY